MHKLNARPNRLLSLFLSAVLLLTLMPAMSTPVQAAKIGITNINRVSQTSVECTYGTAGVQGTAYIYASANPSESVITVKTGTQKTANMGGGTWTLTISETDTYLHVYVNADTEADANVVSTAIPAWNTGGSPYDWYLYGPPTATTFNISEPEELKAFANLVNGTYSGIGGGILTNNTPIPFTDQTINMTADIDLSGICNAADGNWAPIGNALAKAFKGTFDGNNKKVTGLYIDHTNVVTGLFGYTAGGSAIKNLSVDGNVKGASNVGMIVGVSNGGTVDNCCSSGSVSGTGSYIAGVVGLNQTDADTSAKGTVKNSYNTAAISSSASGASKVGGVVGRSVGSIENCYNTGAIAASGDESGGVVGYVYSDGTVKNSYNTASVSGTGHKTGGVVGYMKGHVESCYNTGTISGDGNNVGGVVGETDGSSTVKNAYNTASVSGKGSPGIVGGIVGYNGSTTVVENCYNIGSVSSLYPNAGGITGFSDSTATVKNSVSLGTTVSTASGTTFARVTPSTSSILDNNKARSDMKIGKSDLEAVPTTNIAANDINGADVTVGDSTTQASVFSGWDTTSTWTISGNLEGGAALPTLQDITAPAVQNPILPAATSHWYTGQSSPYTITTAAELAEFAQIVNGSHSTITRDNFSGKTVELADDIDLSTVCGANIGGSDISWEPIGTSADQFRGTFDGKNKKVSGLYINNSTGDNQGLFGSVRNATIQNLGIGGTVTGRQYVGGVVGQTVASTVQNCYNTATVSGALNSIGGIVGVAGSSTTAASVIKSCYNTGAVSGGSSVGGVVGYSIEATVENCYNTGAVTGGSDSTSIGGVVGYSTGSGSTNALVQNCYNIGTISGSGNNISGVVGNSSATGTVKNCVSLGLKVTGPSAYSARVAAGNASDLTNNQARSDMKIGASGSEAVPTTNLGANAKNGADVTVGDSTTQASVFSGWDTTSTWTISGNLAGGATLPTLQGITVTQTPTLPASTGSHWYTGQSSPYTIATAAELAEFAQIVNGTHTGGITRDNFNNKIVQLANDIDLSTVCGESSGNWTAIGTPNTQFRGTFDGKNKKVSGLYINDSNSDYQGLFGLVQNATIQNLGVDGTVTGNRYVAGVAGYADNSTIKNCYNTATISGTQYIAGIAGVNGGDSVLKSCYNTGIISGGSSTGGLAGYNPGSTVENCYNTGAVSGSTMVGGVVGYAHKPGTPISTVQNCYNTGTISGSLGEIGGVVGSISAGNTAQNNVSLGLKVTAADAVGRVTVTSSGTLANNQARSDMKIGTSGSEAVPTTNIAANAINGADVTVGDSTTQAGVFSSWDTNIWTISGNLANNATLPTLKDITATQTPTLPAGTTDPDTVSTPVASPGAGAVASGTTVTLTSATSGARIRYTTDGSEPTASSTVYSSPISITSATTIKAIASKVGMTNSGVLTASYTISTAPGQSHISVSANPTAGGTVTGGGTVNDGARHTVSARANSGYEFVSWTEAGGPYSAGGTVVATSTDYTFTVDGSRILVANFVSDGMHTISVSASPAAGGRVTGDGRVADGDSHTVTARANSGYSFKNWTEGGSIVATATDYTFTATSSRSLVANFTGGGGGGGGGGSLSNANVTTTTTTTIPASTAEGSTPVEISVSGDDVTLKLPESKLEEIIKDAKENVIFDLSGVDNAETAIIPINAAEKLADAGISVTVRLPEATVTISADELASLAEQAGSGENLRVEAKPIASEDLTDAQIAAADGKKVVDINVFLGDRKVNVPVTVSIPYTLAPGETAENVYVWYMDDNGTLSKMDGSYDARTGLFTFTTTHQSYYLIGYEAAQPIAPTHLCDAFTDIKGHWAYDAICYMVENGIMNGVSGTAFAPSTNLDRAMMVQILYNLEDNPSAGSASFSDVASGAWYADAVTWASSNGIVSGYGNGLFGPNDSITREQMASILCRYCEYKGISLTETRTASSFADEAAIGAWAKEAVDTMHGAGILNGRTSGAFDPKGTASRAEIAQMMMSFMEAIDNNI